MLTVAAGITSTGWEQARPVFQDAGWDRSPHTPLREGGEEWQHLDRCRPYLGLL